MALKEKMNTLEHHNVLLKTYRTSLQDELDTIDKKDYYCFGTFINSLKQTIQCLDTEIAINENRLKHFPKTCPINNFYQEYLES